MYDGRRAAVNEEERKGGETGVYGECRKAAVNRAEVGGRRRKRDILRGRGRSHRHCRQS